MSDKKNCEVCESASQFSWRVQEVEKRVDRIEDRMTGIYRLVLGTFAGIVVELVVTLAK